MLDDFESEFDILCLSETWATSVNYDLYNIPGFQGVQKYRDKRKGGGVAIFVSLAIPLTKLE